MKFVSVLNRATDKVIDRFVGRATAKALRCRCVYNPAVCARTGGAEWLCDDGVWYCGC